MASDSGPSTDPHAYVMADKEIPQTLRKTKGKKRLVIKFRFLFQKPSYSEIIDEPLAEGIFLSRK